MIDVLAVSEVLAGATAAAAVAMVGVLVLRGAAARRPTVPGRPATATAACVAFLAAAIERHRAPRRDRREVARDLPEVVEALARAVRAGSSIRGAVGTAANGARGATGADLAHLAARLDRGAPLPVVLDEWRLRRRDVREVALVAVALQIAADAGGSVARALDGVADTIRSQQHLRAEINALASQAEASAVLIALLPLAFAAVAGAADPDTLAFLVSTPFGLVCLATGIVLDVVALVWMRRITAGIQA
ncbi:MAG: type II secretion system F family protein [Acidimicrobiales bacterium]